MEYCDKIGSRGRRSWLLLIKNDEITVFGGETVKGMVVVKGSDYHKAGKWSCTTYRLVIADDVRVIVGRDGWETGRVTEGLGSACDTSTPDTWKELSDALGVSVPSAMRFLRFFRPAEAKRLDEVEAELSALDDLADADNKALSETTVGFGGPTNRQMRNGYWLRPKAIPGYAAEIRLRDPEGGWSTDNIEVVGMKGQAVSVEHNRGQHGGYYAVRIALIPGTEREYEPFHTPMEEAAMRSRFPKGLFMAFKGDEEALSTFFSKVEACRDRLSDLDEHEFWCGRSRYATEVCRVAEDENFFGSVDPLEVRDYLAEHWGLER